MYKHGARVLLVVETSDTFPCAEPLLNLAIFYGWSLAGFSFSPANTGSHINQGRSATGLPLLLLAPFPLSLRVENTWLVVYELDLISRSW